MLGTFRDQTAEYHHKVFDRHGIKRDHFGGTFLSGKAREAQVYGNFWAPYADVDSNFVGSLWRDWAVGAGAPERYFGPGTVLSEQISRSVGAQKFQAAFVEKYKGKLGAHGLPLKSYLGVEVLNDIPAVNGRRTAFSNIDITVTWRVPIRNLTGKGY